MFQYVLFDLDGTLTDSREGITKSAQFALRQQGIVENNLKKLECFIGPPLKNSFMEFYDMSEEQAVLAVGDYRKRYAPVGIFENEVYKGIPEMLAVLKEAGCILAVASSKPETFVNRILKHFSLEQYFDVVVGSNLDGSRQEKEEVVAEALKQLEDAGKRKIDAASCAMVGDRKYDVQGGKNFGLTTIGVSYGFADKGELEKAGADYIARTVRQLQKILLKHGGEEENTHHSPSHKSQENEKKSALKKTADILSPFLIYYAAQTICYIMIIFAANIFSKYLPYGNIQMYENGSAVLSVVSSLSMLGGAGCLIPFLRKEKISRQAGKAASFLTAGVLAGAASIGVNGIFFLLHITESSDSYRQVAESQYMIPVVPGLFLFGVISPIAEEILFRGLIYNRMKKYFPVAVSAIVSSVLFGAYHGNLVQALYGFILGLVIVYAYEVTGNFLIPVFVHAVANIVTFLLSYNHDIFKAVETPLNCMVFLAVACMSLYRMKRYSAKGC